MVRRKSTTIFLDVLETTTVWDVKQMIYGITKRKPEEQMLFKNDITLEDTKKMADYNLTAFTAQHQSPATLGLCFLGLSLKFEIILNLIFLIFFFFGFQNLFHRKWQI